MKIQLIGTGAIGSIRNSASVLINNHILFDVPNGNLKAMLRQKVDVEKIDTIIISHLHGDHCFDMPFILLYKNSICKSGRTVKIITDEDTMQTLELLNKSSHFFDFDENKIQIEKVDIKDVTNKKIDSEIEIINEPVIHGKVKYATGYIFKDKGISVGITGDTSICQGVKKMANQVDYLIADISRENGTDAHMGIKEILEVLKENPKLKIIATHMYDETREKLKELNEERLIIVEDGMVFEF